MGLIEITTAAQGIEGLTIGSDETGMNIKQAILAFSQSEKVKAGIIAVTQALELLPGIPDRTRKGAESMARVFISLILRDVHLAKKITGESTWQEVEKNIDLALVMLDSGVAHESSYHLTRALSTVTDIGQRSMTLLKAKGLL